MSVLDVLPLVDHNALRSFALTSRAMRAHVTHIVRAQRLHVPHALRCALMQRPPHSCVRCGHHTTHLIRQHRLPHKPMCRLCVRAMCDPVPFETWLFMRRRCPYSCARRRNGGRIYRHASRNLQLIG